MMTQKRSVAVWPLLFFVWLFAVPSFASAQGQVLVERVDIQGNRRFPRETILYYIQTREGDVYNPAQLERDLKSLWAQNLFSNVEVLVQDGEQGGKIVIFRVTENPIIRDLKFEGLKSVTESDVLTRFREKRVGVSKEEMWDPAKGQVAKRVLKDYLSEKGHPDATITVKTEELSAAAVGLTFEVNEGPRVRVLEIDFEGNKIFSGDELRKPMKNVRQAGLITRFTSRDIYHPEALKDDLERVRFFVLADHGYLEAQIGQPSVEMIRRNTFLPFRIPLISPPLEGLRIVIPIDEGRQCRFGKIDVEGNTVFSDEQIKAIIGIKPGDTVRSTVIQKGVYEHLKDLYGRLGYIEMIARPDQDLKDDPSDPTKGIADFTITIEEGRQFTLKFVEFVGNTITRDRVLRRELLVSEGEIFDQTLWKLSLQRLNQLGFFEEIKESDATFKPDERMGKLDIDLRVKEKGRNQIQFTGGASGIGGSFFGLEYSTNNLFGYGESLSFNLAAGNRQKYFLFSFTEPYLFDRNISLGFSIFTRSLDFFGGGLGAIGAGGLFGFALSGDSLFKEKSGGFSVFTSTPMTTVTKKWPGFGRWTRLGLSYSYNSTSVEDPPVNRDADPNNDIPVTFSQPDIRTSTVVPSLFYNSLEGPYLDPTGGQRLSISLGLSGKTLGGDVNLLQPSIEYARFIAAPWKVRDKPTVFGFRFLAGHLAPYGRRFESNSLAFVGGTPIFSRFFLGGEDTIRGFNVRSISPVVLVERRLTTTNVVAVPGEETDLLRANQVLPVVGENEPPPETPFVREDIIRAFTFTNRLINISPIPIGGDTMLLFNGEYRIPIAGPVTLAAFADVGSAFNLRRYDDQRIISTPLTQIISPIFLEPGQLTSVTFSPGGGIVVGPNGQFATQEEVEFARLAQGGTGGILPSGFTSVFIRGLGQTTDTVFLSQAESGLKGIDNYRASLGLEFRVLMPVVNVPFRLIFAYNPNAKVNPGPFQIFREERTTFRFSIGRTF
ncbi:MAG: outer membrane protein assembly factor BamA [Acidobacteria bacterium]|nr:outer membrane protein assembly factor BamA [Acidobacteriota bacterium]